MAGHLDITTIRIIFFSFDIIWKFVMNFEKKNPLLLSQILGPIARIWEVVKTGSKLLSYTGIKIWKITFGGKKFSIQFKFWTVWYRFFSFFPSSLPFDPPLSLFWLFHLGQNSERKKIFLFCCICFCWINFWSSNENTCKNLSCRIW